MSVIGFGALFIGGANWLHRRGLTPGRIVLTLVLAFVAGLATSALFGLGLLEHALDEGGPDYYGWSGIERYYDVVDAVGWLVWLAYAGLTIALVIAVPLLSGHTDAQGWVAVAALASIALPLLLPSLVSREAWGESRVMHNGRASAEAPAVKACFTYGVERPDTSPQPDPNAADDRAFCLFLADSAASRRLLDYDVGHGALHDLADQLNRAGVEPGDHPGVIALGDGYVVLGSTW